MTAIHEPPSPATEALAAAQAAIAAMRERAPLAAPACTIIAVSKSHPAEAVLPLLLAGHRDFGENRVQEAAAKWPPLRARFPDLRLHLIGPLQTNKVCAALELFDVIHTLDRPALAEALAKALATAVTTRPTPDVFVQVNIGEEPQKSGVAPADLPHLLAHAQRLRLPVRGLMAVPPHREPPAPYFALLQQLARTHDLPLLSMGMSDDYPEAIRLGATHVRLGRALFGERGMVG